MAFFIPPGDEILKSEGTSGRALAVGRHVHGAERAVADRGGNGAVGAGPQGGGGGWWPGPVMQL
jgi:hypothetical protein